MSSKNSLKTMAENFIEKSIESSPHINKLISGVTIMALETKKIAEAILTLSNRLDDHETIILKLMESQQRAASKDSLDSFDVTKQKEKSSKPN